MLFHVTYLDLKKKVVAEEISQVEANIEAAFNVNLGKRLLYTQDPDFDDEWLSVESDMSNLPEKAKLLIKRKGKCVDYVNMFYSLFLWHTGVL